MLLEPMAGMQGSRVRALNGTVGSARDLYFDDGLWVVRYLVVSTEGWLNRRKVLIPATAIARVERRRRTITVGLTSERVRHSPDVDTHKPVSRQHATLYPPYLGFPYGYSTSFWPAAFVLSMGQLANSDRTELEVRRILEEWAHGGGVDSHLRSSQTVLRYRVRTTTGDCVGRVRDFLFDVQTWHIRYLVVAIRHWFSTRLVLVRTNWIRGFDWVDGYVTVAQSTEEVIHGLSFDPAHPPEGP